MRLGTQIPAKNSLRAKWNDEASGRLGQEQKAGEQLIGSKTSIRGFHGNGSRPGGVRRFATQDEARCNAIGLAAVRDLTIPGADHRGASGLPDFAATVHNRYRHAWILQIRA